MTTCCLFLDECGHGHSIAREAVRLCMVDDTTTMYIDERMVSALSSRRCLQISLWFSFFDRTNQIEFDYGIDSLRSTTIHHNRQQHCIKCIMVMHKKGSLSNTLCMDRCDDSPSWIAWVFVPILPSLPSHTKYTTKGTQYFKEEQNGTYIIATVSSSSECWVLFVSCLRQRHAQYYSLSITDSSMHLCSMLQAYGPIVIYACRE